MPYASPFVLTSLFVAFFYFFLFSFVFGQKRRSRVKSTFVNFLGCIFLVALFEYFIRLPFASSLQDWFIRASIFVFYFSGVTYLHFVYAVVDRKADKFLKFFFALATVGAVVSLFIRGHIASLDESLNLTIVVPTHLQAAIHGLAVVSAGFYAFAISIKYWRKPENERQRRIMRLLVHGMVFSLVAAVIVLMVAPHFEEYKTVVYQFGSLSLLIHGSYMYIAVSRYHFMSVNYDEIEEVSKALFENVVAGIVVIGPSGEVVQTNGPARTLLGNQITVQKIEELIDDYQLSGSYRADRMIIKGKYDEHVVILSQTLIQKDEIQLGKLLVLRDITEHEALEQDRSSMAERLQQAEKLEAIGQLAGGVAHDFNNQLAGITGCADLLKKRTKGDDRLTTLADNILLASEQGAGLTAQLLAFARKGKYLSIPVDMHQVIEEVTVLLEHSIDKQITIHKQLNASHFVTRGDPSQLQNALLNLGLNGRDSMPKGGKLTFTTENKTIERPRLHESGSELDSGNYVIITVSDTGFGMDKDLKQRIFEPFFTTKEPGKGTGMGLAAVWGTVKNHLGFIEVRSEVNMGSVFTIYLPEDSSSSPSELATNTEDKIIEGDGSILLVDDEPIVLETGSLILKDLGYTVTTCSCGEDALKVFRDTSTKFDLVILDLVMPEMNGQRVFEAMNKLNPDISVLLSSGYSMDTRAQEIIEAGAKDFIQKPFRIAELSKAIARILADK